MSELTIISPHRDDVPFSLSIALSRWRSLPLQVNVVTVFTISVYAPRRNVPAGDSENARSSVSSLRKREDRRVFRLLGKNIKLEDLALLDAPLRLGISADSVCRAQSWSIESCTEVEVLTRHFQRYFLRGLVLAPLGLGDHVDHLTVRAAAIRSSEGYKLGFYEDLPYATWVPDSLLRRAVCYAERGTGKTLKSCIIRRKCYTRRKRSIVARYDSQISRDEATAIARFAASYRGGERIWIPKHASAWISLVRQSHV